MKRVVATLALVVLPWAGAYAQTAGKPITFSGGQSCASYTSFSVDSAGTLAVTCASVSTTDALVSVTLSGSGTGTVTGSAGNFSCTTGTCTYTDSSGAPAAITLTASQNNGSTFSGWGGVCSSAGTASQCTVTPVVGSTKSVTATFTSTTAPTSYTLTATAGTGGSVSGSGLTCSGSTCTGTFSSGASTTVTATASNGYTFSGWTGCSSTSGATCTVNITGNQTVSASFTASSADGCTTDSTVPVVQNAWNTQQKISAVGAAYPFTISSASQVVTINFLSGTGTLGKKDAVISKCSGDFTNAASRPYCALSNTTGGGFYVNYMGYCPLTAGTYYLNVRPASGAATSQGYLLNSTGL